MADRSWFFAAGGQQQGPYPETQFRAFIAQGRVAADTLVWTEGMNGWQKAGDIPGLLDGAAQPARPRTGGALVGAEGYAGAQLSIDVGLWDFLGRSLLYGIGLLLVIPAPWAATAFYRWLISRVHVPGRPNLAFTGRTGDLWYVFVVMGLLSYVGVTHSNIAQLLAIALQAILSWMLLRWIAGNLASNGQGLAIDFKGSLLGYVGWYLLMYISFISIIGWAWVITAWVRWICRNVSGTRREIVFNASGLQVLWRTLLFAIGCVFLIPIPWVLRWYTRWYVAQFALIERGALA